MFRRAVSERLTIAYFSEIGFAANVFWGIHSGMILSFTEEERRWQKPASFFFCSQI